MTKSIGSLVHMTNDPWRHPYKAINVLCEDGKRRTVYLNKAPDTYFSWGGRCKIKGVSTRGWVTSEDGDYTFHRIVGSEG